MSGYFEVDHKGLRKVMARQSKAFVVTEPVSNSWDAAATNVTVTLERAKVRTPGAARIPLVNDEGVCLYLVRVEDDDPRGFVDLSHAYTLFAESIKKGDPRQRGRFNIGEKLLISQCERAVIETTTGTVTFKDGKRRVDESKTRDRGTVFSGLVYLSAYEVAEIEKVVRNLIPPHDRPGLVTTYNGIKLADRSGSLVAEFEAPLFTEFSDEHGNLKRTRRKTLVRVHEPLPGEIPSLYELGVPVVETADRYHVDVQQKVPLNTERDNVQPAYLRDIRALVLEHTHQRVAHEPETAVSTWVASSLELPSVTSEVVDSVLTARYGERRVISDMSDPEGTKMAVASGYSVIQPGSFNKQQWASIKRTGAALPAGRVTPSPKPYEGEKEAQLTRIDQADWTPGMQRVAEFVGRSTEAIIGRRVPVEIVNKWSWQYLATYGPHSPMVFNLARLGKAFFDETGEDAADKVVALVVHEASHHKVSDHLDRAFSDENCLLAARMARLVRAEPDVLDALLGIEDANEPVYSMPDSGSRRAVGRVLSCGADDVDE